MERELYRASVGATSKKFRAFAGLDASGERNPAGYMRKKTRVAATRGRAASERRERDPAISGGRRAGRARAAWLATGPRLYYWAVGEGEGNGPRERRSRPSAKRKGLAPFFYFLSFFFLVF